VAVLGKADRPVYLFLHDGIAEIRDASAIWGKSTYDTIDFLRTELGKDISTLTTDRPEKTRWYLPL
jgi:aldehyde:ferredoxin oxidoreductase